MKTTLRCFRAISLTLLLALLTRAAGGYEIQTHFQLTDRAFEQSVLGRVQDNPLLELGASDPGVLLARGTSFAGDPRWGTPRYIVADGARLEDLPTTEGRFMRHFFDPQRGGIGLENFSTSPDWVLEDRGQISLQSYSMRDALNYHWQALTLPTKAEREANLVTLLEILGRSVHHLQDMSQPAHARVDTHAPWEGDIYEAYTEQWFATRPLPSNPVYGGPVQLDSPLDNARSFWTKAGAGIADFSSHNFVSKDTNFRVASGAFQPDPNHPKPVASGSSTVTLAQLGLHWALNPNATMDFVHTQIEDIYSGASFLNDRASTYSIFSPNLTPGGLPMKLSLNRFNFEKNYEILLPRAIAYSSGLINYYFRGRLRLQSMSAQGGAVEITVKNVSDPFFVMEANPQLDTSEFRLFYDARDGVRRELVLAGGELAATLALNETLDLSFVEPTDVDRTKEKPYLLVFNGVVGVEPGMAALAFGSAGSGLLVTPRYPTTDGIAGPRGLQWNDNGWNLGDATGWQAGSVDWKGHNPIDVVTWAGVSGRYRPGSGTAIFMNGRVLARAPKAVVGASIRYIDGVRTLNAASHSGTTLTIYSRPFAESYANNELWSVENPLGWREIYSQPHGAAFTGFFFNASGTEGQYLTQNSNGTGPQELVKVTLFAELALAEVSPAVATVTRSTRGVGSDVTQPEVTAGTCEVTPSAPDGELKFGSGACLTRAYGGVRTDQHTDTDTHTYKDKTLFCVDYLGDTAVFCELLPPEQPQVELRGGILTTELDYAENQVFAPACSPWRRHVRHRDESYTSINSRRMMKIGNVSIPWSGEEHSFTTVHAYAGEFHYPQAYTGTYSVNASRNMVDSKLIYADARSDLVVYEQRRWQGSTEETGSYSEAASEYPIVRTDQSTSSVMVIFSSPDGDLQLYERQSTQNDEIVGSRTQGSLPSVFGCAQRPRGWDTTTASAALDPAAVGSIYSSMMSGASYAVDRFGRIAGSLRLMVVPPSGSSVAEDLGYWHILTNGNLPALIPGTAPEAGYGYKVELIR